MEIFLQLIAKIFFMAAGIASGFSAIKIMAWVVERYPPGLFRDVLIVAIGLALVLVLGLGARLMGVFLSSLSNG